jgi:hypothetical protein
MRWIVAALFVLSLAGCDEGTDEAPVIVEARDGSACSAGLHFGQTVVPDWVESGPSRTEAEACFYVQELLEATMGQDVANAFHSGCLNNACDGSVPLEDGVLWSEDACAVCDSVTGDGYDCRQLLDRERHC